jgi:NAD(P)H-dependent FMN reductase
MQMQGGQTMEILERIRVALILGSVREARFCDRVAAWAAERIEASGAFTLDVVDPAALGFGTHRPPADALVEFRRCLGHADAFVVVTPEYNHGYPGALKLLIDSAFGEWQAKPVAFVSYGGVSGGLRAVEQLRLVFAELHAVAIRDSVSFANAGSLFGAAGGPPPGADEAMSIMLVRLSWWAAALRNARKASVYALAAA